MIHSEGFGKWKRGIKAGCLALLLLVSLLICSCGGTQDSSQTSSTSENQIHGTITDAGTISALCPDGWTSVGVPDLEAEEADTLRTDALRFVKGGSQNLLNDAFIELCRYSSEKEMPEMEPSKWYDNVSDTGDLVTGSHTWNGFTALSMGKPFVWLKTQAPSAVYVAMLYTGEGNPNAASLFDADVQAVLSSVKEGGK